jgi:hypothetical protein
MSKLILSKHDCIKLFLETRYINDIYKNPSSGTILEYYFENDDPEEE